jgi:hypothetical protein
MSLEIFPDSNLLAQDGRIVMLEFPAHHGQSGNSFADLSSYPAARIIRGIETSDSRVKTTLNLHPRSGFTGSTGSSNNLGRDTGAFQFRKYNSASTATFVNCAAVICIAGAAGNKIACELNAIYECRGRAVKDAKPRLVDSRGMDLALNAFRMKRLSGWVAIPHHAKQGYLGHVFHAIVKEVKSEGKKILPKVATSSIQALKSLLE